MAPSTPTGLITFLFTDIEGSTRLWERYPQAMGAAIARHDAMVRRAIEDHGGYVFKTIGDAFCAAFNAAPDALAAAVSLQRVLMSHDWAEIGSLRVRVALNTGTSEERGGDFFGPAVNRVARLISAGYGGQILLSLATWQSLKGNIPSEIQLRDMGERRLRDLLHKARIYQVVAPGLPADFPPLKTLDSRSNNLPAQPTSLIGREKELAEIRAMLCERESRLVTLIGPGGIGKTRMALQLAADMLDDFQDGAFYVNLAPISGPALVAPIIAAVLDLKEDSGQPVAETLARYLRDKELLLVLDNFEHVLAASSLLADLVSTCPRVKALVTSRAALRLYGERQFPVPPLSLPLPGEMPDFHTVSQHEAVQLFAQRAQAVRHDFQLTHSNIAVVVEICRRLDGLPLAIELAAARAKILPPEALLPRLDKALDILTAGAVDLPARQGTLRGAIDWSYQLLDDQEKAFLRRMSAFVGGCTLDAIEQLAQFQQREQTGSHTTHLKKSPIVTLGTFNVPILDLVASLIDKSLLRQEETDGEPRFLMLRLISEYVQERMAESGEEPLVRRRHALHYLALAVEAEPFLTSGERGPWLERLDKEQYNLRAALEWSTSRLGDPEIALRLAGALGWYWYFRSRLSEGCEWIERVLSFAPTSRHLAARAKALNALARLTARMSRFAEARPRLEESIQILRQSGDRRELAFALALLGLINVRDGDHSLISMSQESVALFEEIRDKWGTAYALDWLADATAWTDDYERTEAARKRSLKLYTELGDQSGVSEQLRWLGGLAERMGHYSSAARYQEEALAIDRKIGDKWNLSYSIYGLAITYHLQGYHDKAKALYEEALSMYRELGIKRGAAGALRLLGHLAYDEADYERALTLTREALSLAHHLDNSRSAALCLAAIAGLASIHGGEKEAAVILGAADTFDLAQALSFFPVDRTRYEVHLAHIRDRLGEEALTAATEQGRAMSFDEAVDLALSTGKEIRHTEPKPILPGRSCALDEPS